MEKKLKEPDKIASQRYRRTQNIRVVLSSYLAELRESQYEERAAASFR